MKSIIQHPCVSVIIPAYNQGPMLAHAIESALAQTYPHVEIIVVNDGSTDPITRQTTQAYADRIKYIERENGGVAAARNTGLESATGELIAWLDQDDRWLPHKLQMEVDALQAHPQVALAHSSYYLIDADGCRTGVARLPERQWYALPDLLVEGSVCASSVLVRRDVLAKVGPLDPSLAGSDDWDLWLRIAALGYPFLCLGEPLVEYRVHTTNASHDIDFMVSSSLQTLDKFYTLPTLPGVALRWRGRAYFQKHIAAAALYYGASRMEEARAHLTRAARYHPKGVAKGRALQSLIYSRSERPSWETVQESLRFVDETLHLSPRLSRKLRAQQWLVRALHAGSSRRVLKLRYVGRALLTDPFLIFDPGILGAGKRLLRRTSSQLWRRLLSQAGRKPRARSRV
ncbi:MAG TPA: glycosyltransferase [Chloroflexia bacterium]|nr:glycosyltransferase [Chloroflexia bacterium]